LQPGCVSPIGTAVRMPLRSRSHRLCSAKRSSGKRSTTGTCSARWPSWWSKSTGPSAFPRSSAAPFTRPYRAARPCGHFLARGYASGIGIGFRRPSATSASRPRPGRKILSNCSICWRQPNVPCCWLADPDGTARPACRQRVVLRGQDVQELTQTDRYDRPKPALNRPGKR
jgi:hypothetical protein